MTLIKSMIMLVVVVLASVVGAALTNDFVGYYEFNGNGSDQSLLQLYI